MGEGYILMDKFIPYNFNFKLVLRKTKIKRYGFQESSHFEFPTNVCNILTSGAAFD
jgi:hypothetical protein